VRSDRREEIVMDHEALEILGMVKEGKVTPEQGAELLEAMKHPSAGTATAVMTGGKAKFLRVKVDIQGEKEETVAVNLNVPLALADIVLKLAENAKFQRGDETIIVGDYLKNLSGLEMASVLQLVKEGAAGKLVDVNIRGDQGEQVKVEVIVD
jgi:hypothetical protein